jgi:hypothetical protein
MAGCGGLSAGVRHTGQPPRDGSGGTVRGPAAGSAAVRPQRRGGHDGPTPTAPHVRPAGTVSPMCLRRPVNPSIAGHHGGRVRRSAAVAAGRCAAWVRTPTGDATRVADTPAVRSAASGPVGVQWQNDQQPCPSRLRQKGRSGCVQAAVMEPVGGHLTAAERHPAWTPRPPIRQRGRTQDRTPQAADGQSADRSPRDNFLYRSSRPALRAAYGRPPARQRHDDHRGTGLTLHSRGTTRSGSAEG